MGFKDDWLLFTDRERRRRINIRIFRIFSVLFAFFGVVFLFGREVFWLGVVFLIVAAFFGQAWLPNVTNRR